jgi:hypothetical protein
MIVSYGSYKGNIPINVLVGVTTFRGLNQTVFETIE